MVFAAILLAAGACGWLPKASSSGHFGARTGFAKAAFTEPGSGIQGSEMIRDSGKAAWAQDLEETSKSLWRQYPYFSRS
jgi:hypothetical protein